MKPLSEIPQLIASKGLVKNYLWLCSIFGSFEAVVTEILIQYWFNWKANKTESLLRAKKRDFLKIDSSGSCGACTYIDTWFWLGACFRLRAWFRLSLSKLKNNTLLLLFGWYLVWQTQFWETKALDAVRLSVFAFGGERRLQSALESRRRTNKNKTLSMSPGR